MGNWRAGGRERPEHCRPPSSGGIFDDSCVSIWGSSSCLAGPPWGDMTQPLSFRNPASCLVSPSKEW